MRKEKVAHSKISGYVWTGSKWHRPMRANNKFVSVYASPVSLNRFTASLKWAFSKPELGEGLKM